MAKYKIAGVVAQYNARYRLLKQSEPYLIDTDERADITIDISPEQLEKKRKNFANMDDDLAEYCFFGLEFYRQLVNFDAMMLHGSCVALDGNAFVFSGESGSGKSTHTALWQKLFGYERAVILNDDKPALRLHDDGIYAYGTPFSGKFDKSVNDCARVKGICFVEKADENKIVCLSEREAIFSILNQTVKLSDEKFMDKLCEIIDAVILKVPVYKLQCNASFDAVKLSYETMK